MTDPFAGPLVVPDQLEPVVGYRMFKTSENSSDLHSTAMGYTWSKGRNEAGCMKRALDDYDEEAGGLPEHLPPVDDCTCGFYAMNSLDGLLKQFPHLGVPVERHEGSRVIGQVYLWGRVRVGDDGYRAQYGEIIAILARPWDRAVAAMAARHYDVPVSDELMETYGFLVGFHTPIMLRRSRLKPTMVLSMLKVLEGREAGRRYNGEYSRIVFKQEGSGPIWRFVGVRP